MTLGPQFKSYLDKSYTNLDVDLNEITVAEPPSDASHTTRMELEELAQIIQEAKLPREIMRVADRDPLRLFYSVAKKKGLDPLEEEAEKWADDWTKLSFEFKLKFKRRRPWEVKKEHDVDFVVNKSDTTESPSYPSGHAMMGYGVAEFYKDKYPLMADEWDNVADIIAHSRLQMGVHYPSDVEASKKIVEQLVEQGTKLAEWEKEAGRSAAYRRLSTLARQQYRRWAKSNPGRTVEQWQAHTAKAPGSVPTRVSTPSYTYRGGTQSTKAPATTPAATNTAPRRSVTVSSSNRASGQGVSSVSQPVTKVSPISPATPAPATPAPATPAPATPAPATPAPATPAPATPAPATNQTWGQKVTGWASQNPLQATGAIGAVGVGGVVGANRMRQPNPANQMPKFGSLGHLEQRRSERAKFMSKEDLASLEKKVRRAKDLPEGAHYITLPHGRKGVVRTEDGKSHLATILDARMRPPGRDISDRIKTAGVSTHSLLKAVERGLAKARLSDLAEEVALYRSKRTLSNAAKDLVRYSDRTGRFGQMPRIVIPTSHLSIRDIERLGFQKSLVAVPELGQTAWTTFRHPLHQMHLHQHGNLLNMHIDSLPSMQMIRERNNLGNKAYQALLSTVPEGINPWRARKAVSASSDLIGNITDQVSGVGHAVLEGGPGYINYAIKGLNPWRVGMAQETLGNLPKDYLKKRYGIVKTSAEKLRLYHGSPLDLETLEPRQPNKGAWGERGLYGTPNPLVAALYAIARNDSKGSWGVLPEGRLIAKSKKELNPEGYVYEYDSEDYIPPPEDDLGIGYVTQGSPEILSKEKVYLDKLRDSITRVDDKDKFLEYFKKTSSEQPLYRHRSTLLIRDPETGKLLAAKEPEGSLASPFFFPGGGLYDDEYDTPRNPSHEDIIEGARREALEELGIQLDNPRVVGSHAQELEDWWKAKTLKNRGVPYVGGHEHYVLADKGKEDRSLYNVEGDAFEQGDYYDPKEIVEALSRAAKGDSTFAPFNREQVRAIKDNLLKKKASDLSVLTAVPKQNLDLIMRKGLASQKAISEDPELTKAFLDQRGYKEEEWRKELSDALKGFKPDSRLGASVFFSEPDPDKVSDPRHFINQFDTTKLRVNLGKLLKDIPETRFHGVELEPFNEEAWEADPDNYPSRRHRDLTTDEIAALIAKDPKELWKHYKDEYIGKLYAGDVPHGMIVTPSGIIPPEYLEMVEKTSSAKEQLKHILITGQSGSGKTTEAKRLAAELGMPIVHLDEQKGFGAKGVDPDYIEDLTKATQDIIGSLDKPHIVEGTQMLSEQFPLELLQSNDLRILEADEDELVKRLTERGWNTESGRDLKGPDSADEARHVAKHQRKSVDSLVERLKKKAALEDEFQPDLTPDDLKALGVYDQVYGDAPSEASMKEWPEHWINPQDPLGWLQWYDRYSGGRRTDDDERQIKRWKSFKARHLAQYLKKPTPRRAAALRNWGIDVEKY